MEREFTPREREFTPLEREFTPSEREFTPLEREFTPSEREFTPSDSEFTPLEREFTPSEREFTPSEREFTPSEREFTPFGFEVLARIKSRGSGATAFESGGGAAALQKQAVSTGSRAIMLLMVGKPEPRGVGSSDGAVGAHRGHGATRGAALATTNTHIARAGQQTP